MLFWKSRREIQRLRDRVVELKRQRESLVQERDHFRNKSRRAVKTNDPWLQHVGKVIKAEKAERIGFLSSTLPLSTIDQSVFVSLRHKYVYVSTPKVACSTIKQSLQRLELGLPSLELEGEMIHFRELDPLLRPSQIANFESYVKRPDVCCFAFVRNPYTRVLSAYLDKMRWDAKPRQSIQKALGIYERDYVPGFKEFLTVLESQPLEEMDIHWRPQTDQCLFDSIKFDYLGYFESLETDFGAIMKRFSSGQRLASHTAHATGALGKIGEYYDPEAIKLVNKIYERDFETLGYEMLVSMPSNSELAAKALMRRPGQEE